MLEFQWLWLLLALPLPLLSYFFLPQVETKAGALRLPTFALLSQHSLTANSGGRPVQIKWLAIIAWVLLVIAASRPQWLGDPVEVPAKGRDLMLAVDLSGSMEIEDMQVRGRAVDRLTLVKHVVGEFIERRNGDRVGLILFADNAYQQAPLTFDTGTVKQLLADTVIGLVGQSTAIGEAIGLATKRLLADEQPQKILILLTDGQNTAGEVSPLDAAKVAAEQGVKVYTIGVGADEMIKRTFMGTRKVNPSADLDEVTLTKIAALTGGRYFRARDAEDLAQIYQEIEQLEPVDQDRPMLRPTTEIYFWPLGLAFLLITAAFFWSMFANRLTLPPANAANVSGAEQ
ncbi:MULTISPECIES: vWA domain-containing protein [Corallincola]|uniref:VWA domain-containing protein n=2 Tax=Corallincola TaxID=1775176 RepID=A0ABY1WN02_9GAMM|nr:MULTISPECIES: VWA domain-containing protein [Corallincola]TAA43792.1 VWA domain-containing protein [Corallincola spongiicola]TCI03039.1 VWA domain-containing protein [Corallincola luteus]